MPMFALTPELPGISDASGHKERRILVVAMRTP